MNTLTELPNSKFDNNACFTATTIATQRDNPELFYDLRDFDPSERESRANLIVIRAPVGELVGAAAAKHIKYLWPKSGQSPQTHSYNVVYEASEEPEHLESVTVSEGLEDWLRQQDEADNRFWRGVFSPSYKRRVLFSQIVEFRTADLPRWKPRITIERRMFDSENENA